MTAVLKNLSGASHSVSSKAQFASLLSVFGRLVFLRLKFVSFFFESSFSKRPFVTNGVRLSTSLISDAMTFVEFSA